MDELTLILTNLSTYSLPRWNELPEIDLYMDQVTELIESYLSPLVAHEGKLITPSMINNYVKLSMISKPVKKRYSRNHLASIISITLLKQVFPISEIAKGIEVQKKIHGAEIAYENFRKKVETTLKIVCEGILTEQQTQPLFLNKDADHLFVDLAAVSFVSRLVTEIILDSKPIDETLEDETLIEE